MLFRHSLSVAHALDHAYESLLLYLQLRSSVLLLRIAFQLY